MKNTLLIIALLILTLSYGYCQPKKETIKLNGFYIANSGKSSGASHDTYTYLRFYQDGTICSQSVSGYDPQAVSRWFGRYKIFAKKGLYQINGNVISIQLSNKESKDIELEGLEETVYKGTITTSNKLCMMQDLKIAETCFDFVAVSDTTTIKYAAYKPELKLPGEWKVKQVLKQSGQVFFTNDDSTVVGFLIVKAAKLPFYKEPQTEFETAFAYYEWDSKYLSDEQKMQVKK